MTQSDSERAKQRASTEAAEVVLMLPWYAAGTLRRRDRQRVEAVLRQYPDLAGQVDKVREELAETIHLNETLGAPPPQVAERLMAAIDAEAPSTRRPTPGSVASWLTGFFASLSPRTMAVASSFAMLAIALQAVVLVDTFTRPQGGEPQQGPVYRGLGDEHNGTFAMVRFAQQASAAEITDLLQSYRAAVVDGPTPDGLYRVRIATTSLAREELARVMHRIRQERIVESAEPTE